MKTVAAWTMAISFAWLATACPVYDDTACSFDMDCAPGLYCDVRAGVCVSPDIECSAPDDCSTNETCGSDGLCHVGDCYFHGCVDDYECVGDVLGYHCSVDGQPDDGGGAGTSGAGGSAGTAGSTEPIIAASGAAGAAGAAGEVAAAGTLGS